MSVISLYGASEFSANQADYPAEFGPQGMQAITVQKEAVIQKNKRVKAQPQKQRVKKKEVVKVSVKVKATGYERARKVYGKKVVKVNTLNEAKKIAKGRKDLVVFDKVKKSIYSNSLRKKFDLSELVIMLQLDKRADGEVVYNIYFFKKG